jgi:choline monooxygenase
VSIEPRIDPDIRRAATLPAELYRSPEIYERARERVFARSWQWVGDAALLRAPGQVHPVTLLPGCLDEPLLLTRDRDDRLHCLSNVCTHRGHLVAETGGTVTALRCRYHGRRFDLAGRCQFMPEFEEVEGFPSETDHLPRLAFESWRQLLFASLAPPCLLEDLLAPVEDRVGWLPVEDYRFDPSRSRDYLVSAHWALYVDNYLEGFHIPYVHAGLAQAVDYGTYTTELFDRSSVQVALAGEGGDAFEPPPSSPDHGRRVAAYYFWLFPNTLLNFYPWGLSINVVKPLAVDRTRVSFLAFVGDESRLSVGAGAELDRVEREDEVVVENVQRGLRSRLYHRGRYSPAREQGVHHFHRLLTAALEE